MARSLSVLACPKRPCARGRRVTGCSHRSAPRRVPPLPGEQHTLGPIAFALALHERGWRIVYLGADAPLDAYEATARSLRPELVAMCFTTPWTLARTHRALPQLAAELPLALAGPATHLRLAQAVGARWLSGDPFEAATQVSKGA